MGLSKVRVSLFCLCKSASLPVSRSVALFVSVCRSISLRDCQSARQSVRWSASLSVSLTVSQCASLSVCLSVCQCVHLSVCLPVSVCLSVCLSVCQCVRLSVCLSVYLSVCLSVCLVYQSISVFSYRFIYRSVPLSLLPSLLQLKNVSVLTFDASLGSLSLMISMMATCS